MKWYKVPGFVLSDKPSLQKISVGGKTICLGSYNNEWFAISAYCPHAGALLTGGWCKDGKIVCPFHRYSYDLHTGKGSPGQNDFIDVYPIKQRDDGIYVGITGFWEKIRQG